MIYVESFLYIYIYIATLQGNQAIQATLCCFADGTLCNCVHCAATVTFCTLQSRALTFDLSMFRSSSVWMQLCLSFTLDGRTHSATYHLSCECLPLIADVCPFWIPFCSFLAPLLLGFLQLRTESLSVHVLYFLYRHGTVTYKLIIIRLNYQFRGRAGAKLCSH